MTTPSSAGAYTGAFRDQHGGAIAADVDGTAAAAAAGTGSAPPPAPPASRQAPCTCTTASSATLWPKASTGGKSASCWACTRRRRSSSTPAWPAATAAPARQRSGLAVTCTAGLAAVHDIEPWYGIDVDDLDAGHSLSADPAVARLREMATMLGQDIWITVKLPGEYQGDDDLEDGTAIRRWTTVVLHPDELGGCARPWPSTPRTRADAEDG